jgi:ribosomal protein S21
MSANFRVEVKEGQTREQQTENLRKAVKRFRWMARDTGLYREMKSREFAVTRGQRVRARKNRGKHLLEKAGA